MPIPKISTGPTKGQDRSRNSDGRWRAKRSDSGLKRAKESERSKTLLIGVGIMAIIVIGIIIYFY